MRRDAYRAARPAINTIARPEPTARNLRVTAITLVPAGTKGGVVAAGEQIMLIVPEADDLIVEARVAPQNIDQIKLDQPATVRFPGFNQRTTPELNGRVSRIAADIIQDQRNNQPPYYLVRISIAEGEIARLNSIKLVPGMPVEAFIRTDERTMWSTCSSR
jgi:membrane fusion protein, type I secretion system